MCEWKPASEIPPFQEEILIIEEDDDVPHFGWCFENEDYDDSWDMDYEFHPEKYIWHLFMLGEYRETICPEFWLQLPSLPFRYRNNEFFTFLQNGIGDK